MIWHRKYNFKTYFNARLQKDSFMESFIMEEIDTVLRHFHLDKLVDFVSFDITSRGHSLIFFIYNTNFYLRFEGRFLSGGYTVFIFDRSIYDGLRSCSDLNGMQLGNILHKRESK